MVRNYWDRLGNTALTTMSNIVTALDLTDMETGQKRRSRSMLTSDGVGGGGTLGAGARARVRGADQLRGTHVRGGEEDHAERRGGGVLAHPEGVVERQ